jgi:hypothetical protein
VNVRQVTASRARTAATAHGRPVERRQLTVIFCDLIGSTAFFGELDPEEVGELMRSFRLCCAGQIEAAGGFVAQFQGDGVIGYFGYTEASESNAERAVRAGLGIVRLVPRLPASGGMPLQTRVGIATGLAIVGDPYGDGTRLEQSAVRRALSRPLVEMMHTWLTETLGRISGRSALAQAIRYALNHWTGLVLFLDDGRLEMDTNTVERAMRPVALGRKNALVAGADSGGEHWALVATLIQTAKLNLLDPLAWLTDVLERIVSGRTKRNELHTLLPWNWKSGNPPPVTSSA